MMFDYKIVIIAVLLNCSWFNAAASYLPDRKAPADDGAATFSSCSINVNGDLGEPQPLLLRPGTSQLFHPSGSNGIITLTENQQIELYCSTSFASPAGAGTTVMATCTTGNQFLYNGNRYNFVSFACTGFTAHSARKSGARCYNNGYVIEHGFPVADRFVVAYTSCFDEVREEVYYAYHSFTPANAAYQSGYPRPNFVTGGFFGGKNVDNLYTRNTQRNTISGIVGSYDLAMQYIEETSDVFLARGHLAAKADFIFGNEQRATFYFTNVAPQWQKFNALNWAAVEDGTRKLAADRNINLDVYSGTHGVAQLRDTSSVLREIFLYVSGSTQIPVPKLYYKIIVNKANSSGAVFIGVNNPHLTLDEIKKDYIICTDYSSQISYISWQKDNIERGYSYVCTVSDFLKAVPHVSLSVNSLLV